MESVEGSSDGWGVIELEANRYMRGDSPAFVPKDFEIPFSLYQKNWKFTGRVAEQLRIREILRTAEREKSLSSRVATKHRSERRVVSLCGPGGVGKSQLALMHAHEHVTRAYSAVIWINAHSRAVLDASVSTLAKEIADHYIKETPETYQRFARVLGFHDEPHLLLQSFQTRDVAWKLGILQQWLAIPENHHWLVIIDNSDRVPGNSTSFDSIDSILPEREILPSTGGSVIVTTRLTGRAGIHETIKVKEMDAESGLELLLKSANLGRETLAPQELAEAAKLVDDLGSLPIALDQAGAYIQKRGLDFAVYRDRLQRYFKNVAQAASESTSEQLYDRPAFYWTWDISYRDLQERYPAAAELLILCAFLHNINIREDMLRRGNIFDEMVLNDAVDTLASYSLITRSMGITGSGEKSFSMHALAHKWARIHLPLEDQKQCTKKAMQVVSSATTIHRKKDREDDWLFVQMIKPHLHDCREHLEEYLKDDILDIDASLNAHNLGVAFDDLSLFQLAELPYRKAIQGLENAGEQLKETLTDMRHSLGKNLSYQSRYAEAHECLKAVIETYEQLGRHSSVEYLGVLLSMGVVHRYQGNVEEALRNNIASHDGLAKHHPGHTDIFYVKLEIGYIYQLMGQPETALEWLKPAMVGFETAFGPLHPWTLNSMSFIGNSYRRLKNYDMALSWYQRALAGKEQKLGNEHMSTLATVGAIAETHILMGRPEEGLEGYRRAFEGRKKACSEDSMFTLSAVHGIGYALHEMGKHTEALEYYQRTLKGRRKLFGDAHQQTLETVRGMVEAYRSLGQETEAEILCREYKIDDGMDSK